MAKKKKRDLTASYVTGLWNTYSLEEYNGPDLITASAIAKGMKMFQRKFKMTMDMVSTPQLLFWTLTLEERLDLATTRSQRRLRRKIPIRVFKFAISSDDNLLFCNKVISLGMQKQLSNVLSCNAMNLMKLRGSDPVNLLMMHRQSKKQSPGHLTLQHEEHLATLVDKVQHTGLMNSKDITIEIDETARSKVFQSVGTQSDMIPCVKKVDLSIRNVPTREDPWLRDFRWSHIGVELYVPSVFHLYRETGALNLIPNVPQWLEKIRISGKTEAEARYV